MRRRATTTIATLGCAVALLAPVAAAPASAAPGAPTTTGSSVARAVRAAPDGWRVIPTGSGVTVVWRSRTPVPLRDAAVELRLGNRVLGTARPSADGRTFTVRLTGPLPGPASALRVTAGGLALDADGRAVLPRSTSAAVPPRGAGIRPTTTSVLDPGVPGPYATTRSNYDLTGLDIPGFPAPVEVVGAVVSPVGAPGARPLVLILHGRHSTCYKNGPHGRSDGNWPCRPGWTPVPSHLGYLGTQRLLASQGYVTVSIAANGINGQDWAAADGGAEARSLLVRHHLGLWHTWTTTGGAPFGHRFVGDVDLSHVLLVGHSRGGEGVNRAAVDSAPSDPWHIDGQVLIGPTAFGRQTALGVDTTVLLPYCDGDVSDLQGQQYVDQVRDLLPVDQADPALRSAVLVMGANHNYFNREWTPGQSDAPSWDDWWNSDDPACGTAARLSPGHQRTVGAVYTATSAAAFVERRPRALALLNGGSGRPASLGDATTYVAALGARRSAVYYPSDVLPAPRAVGAEAVVCEGYRTSAPLPVCLRRYSPETEPHFLPMYWVQGAPAPVALRVTWEQPGGRVVVPLGGTVDLDGSTSLEMRVAVAPGGGPARFRVVAVDQSGQPHPLGVHRLDQLPGGRGNVKVWAQELHLPLADSGAGALTDLRALRLVPLSAHGSLVLLDVHGLQPGRSSTPVSTLPRADVSDATFVEGNSGTHTELVHISLSGPVTGGEQLWVQPPDPDYLGLPGALVTLTPGQTEVTVPVTVSGDTRDDYDIEGTVAVQALRGVTTGTYIGSVVITDDDPKPVVQVDSTSKTVAEGTQLRWNLTLSAASDKWLWLPLAPEALTSGTELQLADLGPRFLRRHGLRKADPQLPLSQSELQLWASFDQGVTTAHISLPVVDDGIVEGTEEATFDIVRPRQQDLRFLTPLHAIVVDA